MQKIFMDGQYYDRPSKTLDIGPLDVRQGFNSTLKFSASENFTAGIVYFDIIDAHADTILFSERSKWFSPDKSLTIKWTAP